MERITYGIIGLTLLAQLAACGGSGDSDGNGHGENDGNDDGGSQLETNYTISATVTGLAGSGLVLQNNGADDLTIDIDGVFSFATALIDGDSYAVTIAAHPGGQSCSVVNGNGTVSGDVTDIQINCSSLVAATLSVVSAGPKLLSFSWTDVGADHYRLLKNPDGISGYTQVGEDLTETQMDETIAVHLTDWVNASYLVQACSAAQVCIDSEVIEIGPFMLESIGYLKASNTHEENRFGGTVVLSGDGNTLAVGSSTYPRESSETVVVFVRDSDSWRQQASLQALYGDPKDYFGVSLALSEDGDTLAIGASSDDSSATGIDGDQENNSVWNTGAAYVFQRTGDDWSQSAFLKSFNPGANDAFGGSLTLSADGSILAVGATLEDSSAEGLRWNDSTPNAGAVYLFEKTGDSWSQVAFLKAPNAGEGDRFGSSLALSGDGDRLAVAAIGESSAAAGIDGDQSDNSAASSGAVYIFQRELGEWGYRSYLKASNPDVLDEFGYSIALSADGNTLAVGAYGEDSAATDIDGDQQDDTLNGSGAVYLFAYDGSTWEQQAYIKAMDPDTRLGSSETYEHDWWNGDLFGYSLSLSEDGTLLAVGAVGEDSAAVGVNGDQTDDSLGSPGAAYLFAKDESGWHQRAYVKASNTDQGVFDEGYWTCFWTLCPIAEPISPGDSFGASISLSSDGQTLAVGAIYEDSAATGVGGDQEDNSATDSGAVYLY
jgi:hypothetical protein